MSVFENLCRRMLYLTILMHDMVENISFLVRKSHELLDAF